MAKRVNIMDEIMAQQIVYQPMRELGDGMYSMEEPVVVTRTEARRDMLARGNNRKLMDRMLFGPQVVEVGA